MPQLWYTNPAWWAFAISLLSIVLSTVSLRIGKRGTRSQIERDLVSREADINEAFLRHKVKGPYAHHLQITDENVEPFTAKAVLLLHQINLLREVYEHRDVLGRSIVAAYEYWGQKIVGPWVEADEDLMKALTLAHTEIPGEGFAKWLRTLLPIPGSNKVV